MDRNGTGTTHRTNLIGTHTLHRDTQQSATVSTVVGCVLNRYIAGWLFRFLVQLLGRQVDLLKGTHTHKHIRLMLATLANLYWLFVQNLRAQTIDFSTYSNSQSLPHSMHTFLVHQMASIHVLNARAVSNKKIFKRVKETTIHGTVFRIVVQSGSFWRRMTDFAINR